MKTAHPRVDDWISDIAFLFLVALTALAVLAVLNYVSIWVLSGCFFLYVIIGILVACILSHGRGTRKK